MAAPQPIVEKFSTSQAGVPSAPVSSEPSPGPRTVTVNYSGDLLWHTPLFDAARRYGEGSGKEMDFLPMLQGLTDYVSAADLAICHTEVPFAPEGGPYTGYPMFAAPQAIAETYPVVGWDICTTASNHSLDIGFDGLVRTIDVHERVGVKTSGTYRTEQDSTQPTMFTTEDGVQVAVVSATFSLNGIPLPEGKPWSVQMLDAEQVLAKARLARAQGADVVVVHMHAGEEYVHVPNSQQQEFAETVTASDDVDLVIGQHSHSVQPITQVNGKWVAYGAGNLMARSTRDFAPIVDDGYLATFTFEEQSDGSFTAIAAEYAPIFIGYYEDGEVKPRVHVISESLASNIGPRDELLASLERIRKVVATEEAKALGLTEH